MRYIANYKTHVDDLLVESYINEINIIVNESNVISDIWNKSIEKIKNLSIEKKRKILKHVIYTMLTIGAASNISDAIKSSSIDMNTKKMASSIFGSIMGSQDSLSVDSLSNKYKKGHEWILSQDGWDHIREEEGLRLKAYRIGDGMITVGYGHAEKIGKSRFRVGQKITKEKAEELLKVDIKTAADGVRKMFKDWESEEDSTEVKITQSMFDALVSIAYNAGVGGLRRSELSKMIKNGEYESAGEYIKTFKISKKFPGLAKRRKKESEMFLAALQNG